MKLPRSILVGSSLVSVIAFGMPAQADKVKKIAVPDMRLSDVDPAIGTILIEVLITEASRIPGFSVVSQSEIIDVLDLEKQRQLVGCNENASCIAEIGGALGVDYLLVSNVGRVGATWILNMKLIDVANVDTVSRTYETVRGEPDALVQVLTKKVPELLAAVGPGAKAPSAGPSSRVEDTTAGTQSAVGSDTVVGSTSATVATGGAGAATGPTVEPGAEATTATARDEERGGIGTWPMWTLIGAGGVAMIVAGGLELRAKSEAGRGDSTYDVGDTYLYSLEASEHFSKAEDLGRWALGTGIVGALLVGGGVTWLLLRPAPAVGTKTAVAPLVLDRGFGVALSTTY